MKKIPLLFIIILFFQYSFCQNPYVKVWDKRYGGNMNEFFKQMIQTSDGVYLLGDYSNSSISGDKTENNRQGVCVVGCTFDFWIVKTDSLGNIQWDKTYGGTDVEQFATMQQTSDGGYILAGSSKSNTGFDKSQNTIGAYDYWILKTDAFGNKIWDKDFGGWDNDVLSTVMQTSDGGYLLGGYSMSNAFGDKTQNSRGGYDYWIVKTDASGNKLWDYTLGGTIDDYLFGAKQPADGGYVLAGYSYSGVGGDKTQPNWGNIDFWIIRLDSLGNKLWDKDFGGTDYDVCFSLDITADGNYIAGGVSSSGVSGDKSQPLWGPAGDQDLWIIKIDSTGNKIWDKDFGGYSSEDEFTNISTTSDHGFIIGATSYSPISGIKSENNLGGEQSWMVKTDSLGNYEWDRTAFSMGHEEIGFSMQTRDGCYLVGNNTLAPIGGYKTESNWDPTNNSYDYWIVKFCDSTSVAPTASVSGNQFLCPGTCTDFLNLSVNATTYQWNFPGGNPVSSTAANPTNICYVTPGNFDVTLIASNSVGSDTLTLANYITVYPAPPAQGILQSGDTLFANPVSLSYQWYFNGVVIPAATNYFYVAPVSGNYSVIASDANDCEVEAVINNVIANTNQLARDSNWQLAVVPNPVIDKFKIQKSEVRSGTAVEISIMNVLGEKIYDDNFYSEEVTVDCRNFPSGIYYLELSFDKKTFRTKFLKQ
jgi:hypothetical protein